jgi:hypothetical protein
MVGAELLGPKFAGTRTKTDVFKFEFTPDGSLTQTKNGNLDFLFGAVDTSKFKLKHPQAPVALLMDGRADILVPFLGRANTRFFGRSSLGPSIWASRALFEGNAVINVPYAHLQDSAGHDVEKIEVDESLEMDYIGFGTKEDHVIQAAQAWLESQAACK